MPARSNSLFFTERAITPARRLSWSSTANSDFGMVKLSRTSFSFFTSFLGLLTSGFLAVFASVTGLEKTAFAGAATLGATALAGTGFGGAVLDAATLRGTGRAVATLGAANVGEVDFVMALTLVLALVFDAGVGLAGVFLAAACLAAGWRDTGVVAVVFNAGFRVRFAGVVRGLTLEAGVVGCTAWGVLDGSEAVVIGADVAGVAEAGEAAESVGCGVVTMTVSP